MNQNNMAAPATLTVLLFIGIASSVDPLHCTTVPFKLAVAGNVRVEVMSARVVPLTSVGLAVFVRMATKLKSSHRCNTVAVQLSPGVSACELNASTSWKEWLNNPVQKKSLVDSAGVSHHLSRTGPSHTHTGVQDKSSCIKTTRR